MTPVNIKKLKQEIARLKAENWVLRDQGLRTYDGMTQKADKYDSLLEEYNNLCKFANDYEARYETLKTENEQLKKLLSGEPVELKCLNPGFRAVIKGLKND